MATSVTDLVRLLQTPDQGQRVAAINALVSGGDLSLAQAQAVLQASGRGTTFDELAQLLGNTAGPTVPLVGDSGGPVVSTGGGGGVGGGVGGLDPFNIPQGSAFINPILQLLGQLFGFQQSERESQRGASLNAALALANIRAQGPLNAAELLFAREGLGFPAQGGESPIVQLLGSATEGAGGQSALNIGNNRFTLPTTLSGSQLAGLQGNPNAQGVIQSFATAAQEGQNPDIFQRSINALLPSGFAGVGSGIA